MLKNKVFFLGLAFVLAGCATTQNQTTQLQTKVGQLEQQLAAKDEEIQDLKYEIKDLSSEVDRKNTRVKKHGVKKQGTKTGSSSVKKEEVIIRVPVSAQKVQRALQNAGCYAGAIDGKVGARTKAAISKFQSEHGLKSDGIVGGQTWMELKTYLEPRPVAPVATEPQAESSPAEAVPADNTTSD